MQGRVAPEVKSRLYENTEVRYNNLTLHAHVVLGFSQEKHIQEEREWQVEDEEEWQVTNQILYR